MISRRIWNMIIVENYKFSRTKLLRTPLNILWCTLLFISQTEVLLLSTISASCNTKGNDRSFFPPTSWYESLTEAGGWGQVAAAWSGEGWRTKGHLVASASWVRPPLRLFLPAARFAWTSIMVARTQWLLLYPVAPEALAAQRERWLLTCWQLLRSHLIHHGHFKYNPLHIIIIEDGACDVLMQIGKCWTSFSKYVVY